MDLATLAIAGGAIIAWSGPGPGDAFKSNGSADIEVDMPSQRGRVLPIERFQIVNRALYLAGEIPLSALDPYISESRRARAPEQCPAIYYRLKDHNGGTDPTAPDCATRWKATAAGQTNVTSDCIGGASWCGGFDRYQPSRFAHIYEGWINTDSMLADALGPARCFRVLDAPEVGCFVVAATATINGRKSIGHIGTVVNVPASWRGTEADWRALGVVDVAARDGRANKRTTGIGWFSRGGRFVVSTMQP